MTMKKLVLQIGAMAAAFAFAGFASAEVTVISFGGANQKAQVKAYYEPLDKTGVKVVPGEYNGEQAKIKAMVDTRNVSWDVVEVESAELARGCDDGLYEKLDYAKIGRKSEFLPAAVRDCGIGAFVWSTVLAYNADKVKGTPTGWADFWNIDKFPGKRGLRKGAKFTLEFALLADGVKREDVYKVLNTKQGVDRAFKKLDRIKPYIQWWEAGAQPPQMLASGDLAMSAAYNGRIAAAQKEGKNLKIVWNGSIYDLDYWAIPKGDAKQGEAYKYIQFASKPENQKVYSSEIPYGPTHNQAVALIDARLAADLPTFPANLKVSFANDTQFWVEHGEELEQRFNAWAAK